MGYWGHLVLIRRSGPVPFELGAFGEVHDERQFADGWSLYRMLGRTPANLEPAVMALVKATKGPALVAYVMDSDCAVLEGRSQDGNRWDGILNREMCAGMGGSPEDVLVMYPLDRGLSGAMRWANDSGLRPSEAAITAALNGSNAFAEELFDQLLIGLGIPGAKLDA